MIVFIICSLEHLAVMLKENDPPNRGLPSVDPRGLLPVDECIANVVAILDPPVVVCESKEQAGILTQDPKVWDRIATRVMSEKICRKEMKKYWIVRNQYNSRIKPIVMLELKQLQELFDGDQHDIVFIKLMSSYTANTNLCGTSDIDIGVVLNGMTEAKVQIIAQLLLDRGYRFSKLMNGYYCYNRIITMDHGEEIEIEIKVRDFDLSKDMICLHDYLDNECEEKQKMIYTYLKYKFMLYKEVFPKAYSLLKMLFYNIALLKINPGCKKFITNV